MRSQFEAYRRWVIFARQYLSNLRPLASQVLQETMTGENGIQELQKSRSTLISTEN